MLFSFCLRSWWLRLWMLVCDGCRIGGRGRYILSRFVVIVIVRGRFEESITNSRIDHLCAYDGYFYFEHYIHVLDESPGLPVRTGEGQRVAGYTCCVWLFGAILLVLYVSSFNLFEVFPNVTQTPFAYYRWLKQQSSVSWFPL